MAQPTYLPPEWGQEYRRPHNGMGTTSFILGIVGTIIGLFTMAIFYIVPLAMGATGLVLGILARRQFKRGEASNGKQILWGIILSAVAIVLGIIGMAIITAATHKLNQDLNDLRTGVPTDSTLGG